MIVDPSFLRVIASVACLASFFFTLVAAAVLSYHWMRLFNIAQGLLAIAVFLGVSAVIMLVMLSLALTL